MIYASDGCVLSFLSASICAYRTVALLNSDVNYLARKQERDSGDTSVPHSLQGALYEHQSEVPY